MVITNKNFWEYWKSGMFKEALHCSLEEEKYNQREELFNIVSPTSEQRRQNKAVTLISVGEFLYDYIMIDPTVVKGLDFARSEDFSSLFSLSQFAEGIDLTVATGDMAQLKGYVAEQFIAVELQTKGYDVEFPEDSNNPGWDLLLDGQPFQVKSMANPDGVRTHLDTYPNIPVYVNSELADDFAGHPQVYVSNISKSEIEAATHTTIDHASELMNFEIPIIAFGVSSISNLRRVWRNDTLLSQAVFNVISDTSSRALMAVFGKHMGSFSGTLIFGPAGGITGAMLGTYVGASQGGGLSNKVKQLKAKKQGIEMAESFKILLGTVIDQVDKKLLIKQKKFEQVQTELSDSYANKILLDEIAQQYESNKKYLLNKKDKLININLSSANKPAQILNCLQDVMSIIAKTRVHPYHFQEELGNFQLKTMHYCKRL